jgi:hypothetical protein
LKDLQTKLPEYGKQAATQIKDILHDFASKLETVKRFVSPEAAAQIDKVLNSVKEVLKRVDRMVDEVINDLKKRLDEILADSQHLDKSGATKNKNTLQQESEPFQELAAVSRAPVKPTGTKGGKPTGKRTEAQGSSKVKRSLRRENESADILADNGYKVEQNPSVRPTDNVAPDKAPDYRIEDEVFDNYAPDSGTDIEQIRNEMSRKVKKRQADRIVLNLNDSSVAAEEVKTMLTTRKPIEGLKQVLVVKDGKIVELLP